MSFLNPVNEPVLRFSSTDADAPQINYAARTAGDVKTVLKACLVTGYGAKASAGWSIVNEVDNVCEFVSPSVAMSDYRLGIDDTSAASTTWYYQYQDARVNPSYNTPKKDFSSITKTSSNNGWQLLVTANGVLFVEIVHSTPLNAQVARVTWFGQMRLFLSANTGRNITYWCAGYASPSNQPSEVFNPLTMAKHHYDINGSTTGLQFTYVGSQHFTSNITQYASDATVPEVLSALFLGNPHLVVAQHPAVMLSKPVSNADLYGVKDVVLGARSAIKICVTYEDARADQLNQVMRYINVFSDYWEF